jgi:phage terminase Nu1 subunit (DNA packaging protein)
LNYFNYYTEIEETFVRRRNKHLFLSPLDWALIEQWQERGIPLHIVIRSIESVFDIYDKQPPGTRTIKSLFYCREEIEVEYEEWRKSQAGSADEKASATAENTPFSPEAIKAHIDDAVESLKANDIEYLKEDISRAVARLEELAANTTTDLATLDATLGDIEKVLDRAMLSNWDKMHLKTLEKEVAGQLRGYKAEMDAESYKNTFELMLLKRLREDAGIPRLGLFYL